MRILWLCNIMLPAIAGSLGMSTSVKEGWLDGLFNKITAADTDITLGVCFPYPDGDIKGTLPLQSKAPATDSVSLTYYYGFYENTLHPENYDSSLEQRLSLILEDFKPDIVHCFGTEYPHTLAMARAFNDPAHILMGIQGLMYVYANAYRSDLPDYVWNRVTFRDMLKKDSLKQQHQKYVKRGELEKEALKLTSHITGRTDWDRKNTKAVNPSASYHFMNETLRAAFYGPVWAKERALPHSIFVSQANYPIKGFHYLLKALPEVLKVYPDTQVFAAGDNIIRRKSFKDKLKASSYSSYLLELINKNNLNDVIHFTGPLDQDAMLSRYLLSQVFLSPSSMENSPNSVGEAMLLSMNVITSDAGGVTSMLDNKKEGLVYPVSDTKALTRAILFTFDEKNESILSNMRKAARNRALITHNPDSNLKRLMEIYKEMAL